MAKYSPGMQQFVDIKKHYEDYILFFRIGDFYEFFFEDAVIASKELEITLTSRSSKLNDEETRIPMSGVPYHSADGYIDTLLEKGYKIAMCEQVEDPRTAKGVVKREVVQIITPGTVMEGKNLEAKENNYIGTVNKINDTLYGFGYSDLSTGENRITLVEGDLEDLINEISGLGVKELVLKESFDNGDKDVLKNKLGCLISYETDFLIDDDLLNLVKDLDDDYLIDTFGLLLNYLYRTQKRSLGHLQRVDMYDSNDYMKLDMFSQRNLELMETNLKKDRVGSLLWVLDRTMTAMGGRKLKQWLEKPLVNTVSINNRLSMVGSFLNNYFVRLEVRDILKDIYDLERLSGRVSFGNVNGRDLIQLKKSLGSIPEFISKLVFLDNEVLDSMVNGVDDCRDLFHLLDMSIVEDAPLSIREGNIIKDGYNSELDEYRFLLNNDKDWIKNLEETEKLETGIKNLKVGYNRLSGYYIEIPKSSVKYIPEGRYERRQTLKNSERYITEELKEKEKLILEAGDKIVELEFNLFSDIRAKVNEYIPQLQLLSKLISEIDVIQSFAEISEDNCYVKPVISDNRSLIIEGGRHPVIEKVLENSRYTTNSCTMGVDREMLLITGPNMAGKSTYMRQVALISIMTQIGCYVPADYVEIPLFDQIFTRIGAADDLVSGQSTFMVEMIETRNALSKATANSLILLDEIGRGTSTYDGVAIAQSVIEYVHDNIGAKTLFSTHYHELTVLENSLDKLINIRVCVAESDGNIEFLHKVEEGASDKSYGIHVAELADLPEVLIIRAKDILHGLENGIGYEDIVSKKEEIKEVEEVEEVKEVKEVEEDGELFSNRDRSILDLLKNINMLEISPMDSFNLLHKISSMRDD